MIDVTHLIESTSALLISLVGSLFLTWLKRSMSDQRAADVLGTAIRNSLGIAQQALVAKLATHPLQVTLPGNVPAPTAAAVQYVIDHAGDEMEQLGIQPADVVAKVEAQLGLYGPHGMPSTSSINGTSSDPAIATKAAA